jgi:hypothetical protein
VIYGTAIERERGRPSDSIDDASHTRSIWREDEYGAGIGLTTAPNTYTKRSVS